MHHRTNNINVTPNFFETLKQRRHCPFTIVKTIEQFYLMGMQRSIYNASRTESLQSNVSARVTELYWTGARR